MVKGNSDVGNCFRKIIVPFENLCILRDYHGIIIATWKRKERVAVRKLSRWNCIHAKK